MSMSRAQLMTYLWGKLGDQFTEAGMTNDDTSGNLKEPLDETFVALGFSFTDAATAEVVTGDEPKAMTLARYFGLLAVYDAVMNRVDSQISVGAPSVSKSENRSQFVRQLENALFRAREAAEPFLPTGGTVAFGDLNLGIYETREGAY